MPQYGITLAAALNVGRNMAFPRQPSVFSVILRIDISATELY